MEVLYMSIRHNEQVNEYMYPRKVEQHMTGGQSISVSGEDASVGGSRIVLVSWISSSSLTSILGPPLDWEVLVTLRVLLVLTTFLALGQRPELSSHSPHLGPTGKQTIYDLGKWNRCEYSLRKTQRFGENTWPNPTSIWFISGWSSVGSQDWRFRLKIVNMSTQCAAHSTRS